VVVAVAVLEALDVPLELLAEELEDELLEDELLDPHPATTRTTIASATNERARIEAGTVQGV
jgi:hypothetical protein